MQQQRGSEVGRQRATCWLFKRIDGLRGVLIPETGIFSAEGILETWIYSTAAIEKPRRSNQEAVRASSDVSPHSPSDSVITTHDVVSTNLLRFEARLQVTSSS